MTIRVVAHLTIPAANRAPFKALVDRIMAAVRKNEQGGTLVFEYNVTSPEGLSFLVHEVYADADAYLAHGKNMVGVADGIMDLCKADWAVISGELPKAVADGIKAAGGPVAYYGHVYATIADA